MVKRYSIRTLLVATLLMAVFVAQPLRRAERQRQAREWVASQRGHYAFDYGYAEDAAWYETQSELMAPEFLIRMLGIDAFNPVTGVAFDCDELTTLKPLTGMTSLRTIGINIEMADDIDFSPLVDLPELQSVHFTEWSFVTESQLALIRSLLPNVDVASDVHP